MSQAPIMPLFTDALLGDTLHLSAEDFGAYLLLLIATWRNNGQPLADDDARLARVCRVTTARWRTRLRPILVMFFDVSGGVWRQKKLEKTWQFVEKRRANSIANGSRGGRPKLLNGHDVANPAGSPQVTQTETIQNQNQISKKEDAAGGGIRDPIAEVYNAVIRLLTNRGIPERQARSLTGKWRKDLRGDDGRLLAIVMSVERQNPIDPVGYLTKAIQRASNNGILPNEGMF